MHRQLTFRAAGRVGWFTAQSEGGLAQASAVLAVTGMRFLALRGFVF